MDAKMMRSCVFLPVLIGAMIHMHSSGKAADVTQLLHDARAKYRLGQYAEAVELASQAIERDEELVEAYRLRAASYEAQRRLEQAIADLDRCIELQPDESAAYQARGELHFKTGQIRASIADFDRYLESHPESEPHHWQRGISFYYASEFEKGVRQFELHKTVNPQDVENGIWHYLCKARVDGVKSARAAMIDITSDRRPWAMKVYRMYQGQATPQQVLEHADEVSRSERDRKNNLFYAHLYVGLFQQAAGRTDEARKHIAIAVEKYPSTHYMGDVASVHLKLDKPNDGH